MIIFCIIYRQQIVWFEQSSLQNVRSDKKNRLRYFNIYLYRLAHIFLQSKHFYHYGCSGGYSGKFDLSQIFMLCALCIRYKME